MREMVDCMYEKVYTKGQIVIQEGEPGNYLYVLAGQFSRIHGALMGLSAHLKLEMLRDLGDITLYVFVHFGQHQLAFRKSHGGNIVIIKFPKIHHSR